MTLEDFFTLTEMRDGLTTLLRVNELVTVMQKEKDSVVKNIGEAARQWSTVATTIAVTENRQCLDLFIQLDGLCFIDGWLKDVQNFSNDTGNNVVEESILAFLGALEKLQIDNERSISSGIWMTVKNLIGHSSSKIQDKARALFDGWEIAQEPDAASQVAPKVEALQDGGIDISHANEEKLSSDCAASSQPERVEEEQIISPEKAIVDAIMENGPSDPVNSSNMSNHVDESLRVKEENSVHNSQGTNDAKQTQENSFPEKIGAREISTVSIVTTLESGLEPDLGKDNDANDLGVCSKNSPSESRNDSRKDNWMDYKGSPNHCKSKLVLDTKEQVTSSGEVDEKSEEHSGDEDGNGSENDSDIFKPTVAVKDCGVMSMRSDMELDYGMVDPLEVARQVAIEVEREVDCREPSCSSSDNKTSAARQPDSPDSANRKQSEGPCKKLPTLPNPSPRPLPTEADPVINEETLGVDRENCIYDMPSSQLTEAAQESEANMAKGFSGFDLNQEVCSEEANMPTQISIPIPVVSASRAPAPSGVPNAPLQFVGALGWKGSAATSAFRRIPEGERTLPMLRSHTNSRQQLDSLDFDLNVAEGGGEDEKEFLLFGQQIPNSSGFPSGEESSIEVASPRRSEKLPLDLNHSGDCGVDALLDRRRDGRLFQNQNARQSPSHSSSSSSMQPSLKNFDLNMNDQQFSVQDSLSDDRLFGKSLRLLYASRTPSDASVVSNMGARVENKPKDSGPLTLPQPNGRIVEQHQMDLNLGRSGGFLGMGSYVPYNTNSPIYGFNGIASGGSGMPFSSSMYGQPGGSIPYMVDSRGAPVVPQFLASASSQVGPFSQPTPFMMSMAAAGTSNGAGPSRQNFDLNSGLMIDGGNRETGLGLMINGGNREAGLGLMNNGGSRETGLGLRQFFNPGQGRSLDDHLGGPQQATPPSSSQGSKRQEPDGGYENYQFNFKHHQPSWK